MSCIDPGKQIIRRLGLRFGIRVGLTLGLSLGAGLIGGCHHAPPPSPPPAAPPVGSAAPGANPGSLGSLATRPGTGAAPAAPAPRRPAHLARHWDDYRQQAAQRIVEANPAGSYLGPVPEPLLAIPVLEVELNADGSVRRIQVTRKPGQALDTVQLAIDAVQRAAPFGPVAHLPRPWKFTEVFLFDGQRRFKPRSLDL